jgi:ESCRT-I complex subunit VPS37
VDSYAPQRYAPSFLLLRLKHATIAQDELSEVTATAFVHVDSEEGERVGTKEVDDFIKTFKEQRITFHKRTIWSEHWSNEKVTWPDD